MIEKARVECRGIHDRLEEIDYRANEVRPELEKINTMFSMEIDFDKEWMQFIGNQVTVE